MSPCYVAALLLLSSCIGHSHAERGTLAMRGTHETHAPFPFVYNAELTLAGSGDVINNTYSYFPPENASYVPICTFSISAPPDQALLLAIEFTGQTYWSNVDLTTDGTAIEAGGRVQAVFLPGTDVEFWITNWAPAPVTFGLYFTCFNVGMTNNDTVPSYSCLKWQALSIAIALAIMILLFFLVGACVFVCLHPEIMCIGKSDRADQYQLTETDKLLDPS